MTIPCRGSSEQDGPVDSSCALRGTLRGALRAIRRVGLFENAALRQGGKLHLKLNTGGRPIAHKYREGKMQRTLKRELKGLEIVEGEALSAST